MKDKTNPTSVRFTPLLHEKIRALASYEHRSISEQIVIVMEQWCKAHPQYNARKSRAKVKTPTPPADTK